MSAPVIIWSSMELFKARNLSLSTCREEEEAHRSWHRFHLYTDQSEQSIDAFGPNGEDVTILNEFSVRAWYGERFAGRKTVSF
jgi:hypothetical protein